MKKTMGLLAVSGLFAISAMAQTQQAATPTNTVQTSTAEATAGLKGKFGANMAMENAMGVQASKDLGRDVAPILTAWTAGLSYKVTPKVTAELQQLAYSRSNLEGKLEGTEAQLFNDNRTRMVMFDTVIKGGYKSEFTVLGSKPLSLGARYYLPTSQLSRQFAKRNGILRADTTLSWDLDTKWTFDYAISPRITFNSPQAKIGSDAVYRMVMGPAMTYNFSDKTNVYGAVTADTRSVGIGRGTFEADNLNLVTYEAGANFVMGPVTINPAISSDNDFNDGSAGFVSKESRVFAADAASYNLNIYATF